MLQEFLKINCELKCLSKNCQYWTVNSCVIFNKVNTRKTYHSYQEWIQLNKCYHDNSPNNDWWAQGQVGNNHFSSDFTFPTPSLLEHVNRSTQLSTHNCASLNALYEAVSKKKLTVTQTLTHMHLHMHLHMHTHTDTHTHTPVSYTHLTLPTSVYV